MKLVPFRGCTRTGRGRTATAVAAAAGAAALALGAAAPAAAADVVSVEAAKVSSDDVTVSVTYRCAAGLLALDALKVSVADSTTGGVFRATEQPRCDGKQHKVDIVAARRAGPAPAIGDSAVITASLGSDAGGLLFSPVVSDGGAETLR